MKRPKKAKSRREIDKLMTEKMRGRESFVTRLSTPCFTSAQISQLIALVNAEAKTAEIGHADSAYLQADQDMRRSSVVWLLEENYPWVYQTMREIAKNVNDNYYMYDINPYNGPVQIAMYDESNQGHFDWHMDTLPSDMTRKLSISIPLNNKIEFEGGQLEFKTGNALMEVEQVAGVPVVFPSWLPHRVSPVTKGRRYSMVSWFLGPQWR
ncbi:MAG: 2OG-Fe(II) oxygenase [Halioglobus sp.]